MVNSEWQGVRPFHSPFSIHHSPILHSPFISLTHDSDRTRSFLWRSQCFTQSDPHSPDFSKAPTRTLRCISARATTTSGNFLFEPGNTVVCHLQSGSPSEAVVIDVRERMRAMPDADRLAFTPISSLHMTLFQGIIEHRRRLPYWPQDVPLDTSIDDMTSLYLERLNGFQGCGAFKIKVVDVVPTGLTVAGASDEDERIMRAWRDALSVPFGYRHPDHDTYAFHVTFAYQIRRLDDERAAEWQVHVRRLPFAVCSAGAGDRAAAAGILQLRGHEAFRGALGPRLIAPPEPVGRNKTDMNPTPQVHGVCASEGQQTFKLRQDWNLPMSASARDPRRHAPVRQEHRRQRCRHRRFPQGQMVGIIGRSGAGKSTLLRMINRLIDPSRGIDLLWRRRSLQAARVARCGAGSATAP